MSVSLITYIATFFAFICNYTLTLTALAVPKWLVFVTPGPIYTETDYGLFKLCNSSTNSCRPFPSSDLDCDQEGFCELWRGAAAGMVLAALLGGITIIALLGTICGGRKTRNKAWMTISGLCVLHAIPQASAMGITSYLFHTSGTFYMGTRYNASFALCTVSWCFSVFLAAILYLVATLSPSEYAYESID